MRARLWLLLVMVLAASSVTLTKQSAAQLPTPSTPQFTVRYVDYSYYIPPTYGIDPYTGQNVTVQAGSYVDNRTVEFTIRNQPFIPAQDLSGNTIGLYYNFRYKGHFGDQWSYYPFTYWTYNGVTTQQTTHSYGAYSDGFFHPYAASNSASTVITIPLSDLTSFLGGPQIPNGSQVDFEVQAQLGTIYDMPSGLLAGDFYNFTGQTSSWSDTQTITIGKAALATTPPPSNQTASPTAPLTTTSASTFNEKNATQTPSQPNLPSIGAKPRLSWNETAIFGVICLLVMTAVIFLYMSRRIRVLEDKLVDSKQNRG